MYVQSASNKHAHFLSRAPQISINPREYSQQEVESPGGSGAPDIGCDAAVESTKALRTEDGAERIEHAIVVRPGPDHAVVHCNKVNVSGTYCLIMSPRMSSQEN